MKLIVTIQLHHLTVASDDTGAAERGSLSYENCSDSLSLKYNSTENLMYRLQFGVLIHSKRHTENVSENVYVKLDCCHYYYFYFH